MTAKDQVELLQRLAISTKRVIRKIEIKNNSEVTTLPSFFQENKEKYSAYVRNKSIKEKLIEDFLNFTKTNTTASYSDAFVSLATRPRTQPNDKETVFTASETADRLQVDTPTPSNVISTTNSVISTSNSKTSISSNVNLASSNVVSTSSNVMSTSNSPRVKGTLRLPSRNLQKTTEHFVTSHAPTPTWINSPKLKSTTTEVAATKTSPAPKPEKVSTTSPVSKQINEPTTFVPSKARELDDLTTKVAMTTEIAGKKDVDETGGIEGFFFFNNK